MVNFKFKAENILVMVWLGNVILLLGVLAWIQYHAVSTALAMVFLAVVVAYLMVTTARIRIQDAKRKAGV